MADKENLGAAKKGKNDEFYTQYGDVEAEMNAYVEFNPDVFRGKTILLPCDDPEWSNFTRFFASNFSRFGLKKLISTSYARGAGNRQTTLFESSSPLFDATLHETRGKLFTLTRDVDGDGKIDLDDVEFSGYLKGDGDFRSAEVTKLRDEADFVITNPPFSLFREFLAWIMEGKKKFIILGNKNAITYKEVFPYIKGNRLWLGATHHSGGMDFYVPDEYSESQNIKVDAEGRRYVNIPGPRWFTNVDNGWRHKPLLLDTMEHNLKFNNKLREKFIEEYGVVEYPRYDNYDAIEVPFTECIPSDYSGVMGVPITFMDKYNPDQFEIIDITKAGAGNPATRSKTYPQQVQVDKSGKKTFVTKMNDGANIVVDAPPTDKTYYLIDDTTYIQLYPRILIRHKQKGGASE